MSSSSRDEPSSSCVADRAQERERLVKKYLELEGIKDQGVLSAMRRVPRHHFVPETLGDEAYQDRPLPIGQGQTISQPFIVGYMTDAARVRRDDQCLEIGTGSGYQAAVLSEMCDKVYSIEYLPDVAELGRQNLRRCGYGPDRVELRIGDGYEGWPERAPFEVILVTAAPEVVPSPLLRQLAVGGRLVIPVGSQGFGGQRLERWIRRRNGEEPEAFQREVLLDVRFVPMLGIVKAPGDGDHRQKLGR